MVWWQIVLICLIAIVVGVSMGVLINFLVGRFRKKRVTNLAVEGDRYKASIKGDGDGHKIKVAFVPLLSRRSILILSIGLIVGAGLGMGYWAISPSIVGTGAGGLPIGDDASSTVYESRVPIMVSAPSAAYVDAKDRSRQAEYWQSKFDSPVFFEFLSSEITEKAPNYSYTTSELRQILSSRFDGYSPEFQIIVRSHSEKEVKLLVSIIPDILRDYLVAEERAAYQELYIEAQKKFDIVQTDLTEARRQLDALVPAGGFITPEQDSAYIVANAKVAALERQLQDLFTEIASYIASGLSQTEYQATLLKIDRVGAALAEARTELANLRHDIEENNRNQDPAYVLASARVETLSTELASLASNLTSLSMKSAEQPEVLRLFAISQPLTPTVVQPDRIRRRDALLMGGVIGVGFAWVGLNFKGLMSMVRSSSVPVARREEEDDVIGEDDVIIDQEQEVKVGK
jgi:hypothetical protein